MKLISFSNRNAKEIIRDPLNLFFGILFPIILLLLLTLIQSNIPVSLFELDALTPGISVFGLSFITLFTSLLISRDRESAFLQRLYTSPITAPEFILGYALPILPISLIQSIVCYLVAVLLGLKLGVGIIYALIFIIPVALLFISFGLLFGSILNVKQVGGICGALFTNLSAWLSGIWFDLNLIGGAFKKLAYLLPFAHAVDLEKLAFKGDIISALPHLYWVIGYALIISVIAIFLFLRQMKNQ